MCDMRSAARTARLSEGSVRLGPVPGEGGCWLLPRPVAVAKASELLRSGEFVDAEMTHRIAMANRGFGPGELMAGTCAFAGRPARHSPTAMAAVERTTCESADLSLEASLDLISSHLAVIRSGEDFVQSAQPGRERR
jgi:enoyl-CoA hydratase/carnithine racemase